MSRWLFQKDDFESFFTSKDISNQDHLLFLKSKDYIVNNIYFYDIERLPNQDYFCIFQNNGLASQEDIIKNQTQLKGFIFESIGNLVSTEEETTATIIWEVYNHMIVVKGFENVKDLAKRLLLAPLSKLDIHVTPEIETEFINKAKESPLINKTFFDTSSLSYEDVNNGGERK